MQRSMMVRQLLLTIAALIATVGLARGQEEQPKRHHKPTAAKTETTAAPQDPALLPEQVQKWFGSTVDGILTGADKTLSGDEKK